jgi:hypothetical protein
MKSHMNVICLQYRSLPLCQRSGLGASGTGVRQDPVVVRDRCRWRGSRHIRHPRPRPQEVPPKVRYPAVKAVLSDDVLLLRRGRPLVHVQLQLADERCRRSHALMRPPSRDET